MYLIARHQNKSNEFSKSFLAYPAESAISEGDFGLHRPHLDRGPTTANRER
jgi:hypothetical protein